MTVVTVNSSRALMNAVQFATDGDVIKLAPGAYSGIILKSANFANGVTVTSADPNNPATITDLRVRGSDGLTFSNLNFTNTGNLNLAFQFSGSSNLTLDNLKISGVPGSAAAMNAQLMVIRDSSNVQLTNSEFSYGWHGVTILNTDFATVQDNYFHDLRTDGVRGGGNSDYTIRGNVFTNFHPAAGDHPDAIQIWTTQTNQSASNITIESNVIMRGNGSPMQGIFIRDVSGSLPFQNVIIADNMIAGALFNGIAVNNINNGYIADNIVQAFAGQPSGIQMPNMGNVVVQSNQASRFFGGLYGLQGQQGNAIIPVAADQGIGIVNQWLSQHAGFVNTWSSIDPTVLSALHWNGTTGAGGGPYVPPSPVPTPPPTPTPTPTPPSDQTDTPPPASDGGTSTPPVLGQKIVGTANADTIDGSTGDDSIVGLSGNDVLRGGDGHDRIEGNSGNDKLIGGLGDDRLHGSDGNDAIDGGSGNDIIDGGPGDDAMTGGAGADVFRFRVTEADSGDVDVITDFQSGTDRIHIVDNQSSSAAEQTFIGTQAFHRQAGEIRYVDGAAGVTVQVDVNGDGAADFDFAVRGVHELTVKDFIL